MDEKLKLCGFDKAWIGPCKNPVPCSAHLDKKCASCGATAIGECPETGQFMCGELLCGDCEHTIFPSGTNGGIGFNAESLPDGMKRHCKKTDQRYKPWYARSSETDTKMGGSSERG